MPKHDHPKPHHDDKAPLPPHLKHEKDVNALNIALDLTSLMLEAGELPENGSVLDLFSRAVTTVKESTR